MTKNKEKGNKSFIAVKVIYILHDIMLLPFIIVSLYKAAGMDVSDIPSILMLLLAIPAAIVTFARLLFIPYIVGVLLTFLYILGLTKKERSRRDIILFVVLLILCIWGSAFIESAYAGMMSV
jgi:hypothetical protein